MWSHLKEKGFKIPDITSKEINNRVDPVLRKMEKNGIKIDVAVLNKLAQKIEKKINVLEKNIIRIAGQDFNIGSPSQIGEILFKKLKLPTQDLKKTKSGFSTAASELKKIEDKHKIISPILEYRELSKLLSTYLKPLPDLVDKNSRLHTHYGQDTSTGRITSNNPNLQNIPIKGNYGDEIRKAFVADRGKVLISADYSQIELRVVACFAQDEVMIDAFLNNKDIHAATAAEIFNIDINKVTPDQRRVAKTVNFGVLYGMSPYGLSQALLIDQEKAALYIKRYFTVHSGIKDYCNRMIDLASEKGYVETLFGFKRLIEKINSSVRVESEAEERIAINTPVQGTAAEILKLAMIKIGKKLPKTASMLLTIHDEIVVEAQEKGCDKITNLIQNSMEEAVKICVPIIAEVKIGKNWAEMKKV